MLLGMSDAGWMVLSAIGLLLLLPLLLHTLYFACCIFRAIGDWRNRETRRLIESLADPDPDVRRAVANTLGEMGSRARRAIEALERLSRTDADETVRDIAKRALARVRPGGKANK